MKEEIPALIEKSEHALRVAQDLRTDGYAPDAVSKAYYSMFYAAQALLKSENIDVTKHSAVESTLGYHFVKSGKLDSKYHRMFIEARKFREIADYDIQEEIVQSQAIGKIEEAKVFLSIVKSLIKSS